MQVDVHLLIDIDVTFAELYFLPMTMLCAVEGVTRAGVVDAAGVAGKSASEMGHSR